MFLVQFENAGVSFAKAAELVPSDARYQNSLGNSE